MTKREKEVVSQAMGEVLECQWGWEVWVDRTVCPQCDTSRSGQYYCDFCGTELVENDQSKTDSIDALCEAFEAGKKALAKEKKKAARRKRNA